MSGSITALRRGTSVGFIVLGYKGKEGIITKSRSKHAKGAFSIPHSPTTSNSDAEMLILPHRYLTALLLILITGLLFLSTHIQTGDLQIQSYAYYRNRNHPRAISSSKFTSLKENPSSTINVLRRSRTRTRSDLNLNLSGNIGIGVCSFNYWYYYVSPPLLPSPRSLSSFLLLFFF